MSVDNMRSIVLLLCTCIANFRFYKPSFPYCARLCWIKKWQQQQPESVLKNLLKINRPKVFDNDWKQQPAWCCQLSVVTLPFPFSIPITAVPSATSPAQCYHAKLDSYVGAAPAKDQRTPCIHDPDQPTPVSTSTLDD